MYPSRPSSTDPNAAYRDAITAFADNRIDGQEEHRDDAFHDAPGQNQPNRLAGLHSTRTNNRDRLNAIARNLGANVGIALELIENSNRSTATTEAATTSASSVTVDTIRQYLRQKGFADSNMMDLTIQDRLNVANLSAETLFFALQTIHTAEHRLLAVLGMRSEERESIIFKLSGIITRKNGFPQSLKRITKNCNNNADHLITDLLQYVRNS